MEGLEELEELKEKREEKKEEKLERRVEIIAIKSKSNIEGGRFKRQRTNTTAKTK